jgi:predicted RND superfamily exporter protein
MKMFCVDFSTHVCHAFVQSEDNDRNRRVELALNRSGGSILSGALSTIIGVSMLIFSNSFIFFSFFKVMFLAMVFGLMYSMLSHGI